VPTSRSESDGRLEIANADPCALAAIAMAVGVARLVVMLKGGDGAVRMPRGASERLALLSGLLRSIATTGIREPSRSPAETTRPSSAGVDRPSL